MSKERDTELSDLERKLREGLGASPAPHIARPDHLDQGPGGLCWLDGGRRCYSDCVAFNAEEGLDETGEPIESPRKCNALTGLMQIGSLVQALSGLAPDAEQVLADRMPKPPDPLGRSGR